MKLRSLALATAILVVGCTKDKYGDPLTIGEEERAAAQSLVEMPSSLEVLASGDAANEEALASVSGVYEDLQVLMEAKITQGGIFATITRTLEGPTARTTTGTTIDETCFVQAEDSVTYTNCDTGAGILSGTVTWSGSTASADLEIVNDQGDYPYTVEVTADALLTDTEVSGEINFLAYVDQDGVVYVYDAGLTYDIDLTDNCPTGGYFEVYATFYTEEEPDVGSVDNEEIWIKTEFGPDCGDVTIY